MKTLLHIALFIALAPLLPGIATKTKAWISGRKGTPLTQLYWDMLRLLRKGATFSKTSTALFRLGPSSCLGAILGASLFVPLLPGFSPLAFSGDFLLIIYLLAVARFFTVLAALDTGSSFEGMGASRELMISILAEPALFLCLAVILKASGSLALSTTLGQGLYSAWSLHSLPLWLAAISLFMLLLAENCRIPVDDPTTHLELTMIHEVMVLDHSGPDFAYITLGAALKFTIFSALLADLLVPALSPPLDATAGLGLRLLLMGVIAVSVGVVESTAARLRMDRIKLFLTAAVVFPAVGLLMAFL